MCHKSLDDNEAPTNLNIDPATDDDRNDSESTGMTIKQNNIITAVVGDESTDVWPDWHLSEEDTEQESPSSVQT